MHFSLPSAIGFLDAFVGDTIIRLTIFLPFFLMMVARTRVPQAPHEG